MQEKHCHHVKMLRNYRVRGVMSLKKPFNSWICSAVFRLSLFFSLYSNHMTQKAVTELFSALKLRGGLQLWGCHGTLVNSSCLFSSFPPPPPPPLCFPLRWSGSIQSFPAHRVQRGESGILASMRGIQEDQVAVQDGLKSQENICGIHRYPVL